MEKRSLLKLIESNAKLTAKDLGDILEESESKILETLTEFERTKVISGYHTVINWDKTNYEHVVAIIEVRAIPESDKGYDGVANSIGRHPEVSSVYLVSGNSEFLVFVSGKTMQEVSEFVAYKLAPLEGVIRTRTQFILRRYKIDGVVLNEEEEGQERMLVNV